MKPAIKLLAGLAVVTATAAITFCATVYELDSSGKYTSTAKLEEVERYLDTYFVDAYDEAEAFSAADRAMGDAGAAAMVEATGDKWSYYISADDAARFTEQTENAYVGIGVSIVESEEAGGLVIQSVTPGSPAEESGIRVGDVLTQVEGESVLEIGQEETVSRVRGEEGTTILLTLLRDGAPYTVTVTRRSIQTTVAELDMLGSAAWIRIKNFDSHCAEQTLSAIESALQEGARAIVFDVRNNPGGYKTELVKVLDRLLPEGILFQSRDYSGKEEIDRSDAVFLDLPMAVLVNENTASAAEFFAAALQEYKAAVIVGAQTGGKGNYQNRFPLSDGSILAISVGKYFTPEGRSLTDVGVTPDIPAEVDDKEFAALYYGSLAPEDDSQLQAALDALSKSLDNAS